MRIIFFDTETCGLPKNYRAPASDVDNWPRMIQIAWIQHNTDTEFFTEHEYIIKPDGFEIPEESSKIHGITTEIAMKKGFALKPVLEVFAKRVKEADLIVGHNISFDRKIAGAEFVRNGIPDVLHGTNRICTMWSSTKYCKIKGKRGYKWPGLEELYMKLFNKKMVGAHDALIDIRCTAECYFELVRRNVIVPPIV